MKIFKNSQSGTMSRDINYAASGLRLTFIHNSTFTGRLHGGNRIRDGVGTMFGAKKPLNSMDINFLGHAYTGDFPSRKRQQISTLDSVTNRSTLFLALLTLLELAPL